jgi:hypothetical protein
MPGEGAEAMSSRLQSIPHSAAAIVHQLMPQRNFFTAPGRNYPWVSGTDEVTTMGNAVHLDTFQGRTEFPPTSVVSGLELTRDQVPNLRMLGSGLGRIRGNSVRPCKSSSLQKLCELG